MHLREATVAGAVETGTGHTRDLEIWGFILRKSGTSLISFKIGSDLILSNVSSIEFLKGSPLLKWRIMYSFRLKMI